jgi:hypothetical protein
MIPSPASPREATPIEHTRSRLDMLLRLIDETPQTASEQAALLFIIGEELIRLTLRIWRASR